MLQLQIIKNEISSIKDCCCGMLVHGAALTQLKFCAALRILLLSIVAVQVLVYTVMPLFYF